MIPAASPRGEELTGRVVRTENSTLSPTYAPQSAVGAVSGGRKGPLWWCGAALCLFFFLPIVNTVIMKARQGDQQILSIHQAQVSFQSNPAAAIAELKGIISGGTLEQAKQRLDLLAAINNAELDKLREQVRTGLEQQAAERERLQQAEIRKAAARYAQTNKALAACKRAITEAIGASRSVTIPDSQNYNSGTVDPDEFYFAWPHGSFKIETNSGVRDMSASCTGSLGNSKIDHVTINGRDIIENSRKVRN